MKEYEVPKVFITRDNNRMYIDEYTAESFDDFYLGKGDNIIECRDELFKDLIKLEEKINYLSINLQKHGLPLFSTDEDGHEIMLEEKVESILKDIDSKLGDKSNYTKSLKDALNKLESIRVWSIYNELVQAIEKSYLYGFGVPNVIIISSVKRVQLKWKFENIEVTLNIFDEYKSIKGTISTNDINNIEIELININDIFNLFINMKLFKIERK